jgi:hypothetical protein
MGGDSGRGGVVLDLNPAIWGAIAATGWRNYGLRVQVERRGLIGSELAARRAGRAEASNARSSMIRTAAE